MSESGWHIALASARPITSLEALSNEIGVNVVSYFGAFQGSLVVKQGNDSGIESRIEFSSPFEREVANAVYAELRKCSFDDLWWYTLREWWVSEKATISSEAESNVVGMVPEIGVFRERDIDDAVYKFIGISLRVRPVDLLRLEDALQGLAVVRKSQSGYFEISPVAGGKDKGLGAIRNCIGDSLYITSIGDGENDVDMFRESDTSVTFRDGNEVVLRAASCIVDSHRPSGLEEFFTVCREIRQRGCV